jgi:hypothetical protein
MLSTIGIHYMAHKMNLVVQNLPIIPMVSKLEDILQSIYKNLSNFPKHHLEFKNLLKLWKHKV